MYGIHGIYRFEGGRVEPAELTMMGDAIHRGPMGERAATPSATKVRRGRLKHLMKEERGELLSDDILDREKRGFGTHMGAWLKRELAPLLLRLPAPDVLREPGLFDTAAVATLINAHENNRTDGTDALSRRYLDRREPAEFAAELNTCVQ
jgi:asparagine synthase (glutamine-hydrolysing)